MTYWVFSCFFTSLAIKSFLSICNAYCLSKPLSIKISLYASGLGMPVLIEGTKSLVAPWKLIRNLVKFLPQSTVLNIGSFLGSCLSLAFSLSGRSASCCLRISYFVFSFISYILLLGVLLVNRNSLD